MFKLITLIIISALVLMQFYPVYRNNPPVTKKITFDAKTEQLLRKSCYDCHSNETEWPWYSNIAPMSWFVAYDVNKGRTKLNFSTGNIKELDEVIEEIRKDKMPLIQYTFLHPSAKLTQKEKQDLIYGLQTKFSKLDTTDKD